MAAGAYIQSVFYHYILSEPTIVSRFEPNFFIDKNVQIAFSLAKDYVMKYHSAPTSEQMKQLARIGNVSDNLTDDKIDVLYGQKQMLAQYTNDWLYDEVINWGILENMKKSLVETASYIKLNQDDMEAGKAKEIVEHAKAMFNKSCIIEFSDENDTGSDFWDAESHRQKKLKRSPSGYDFIDFCLNGGYFPGCLICFVGQPKVGKSLWLQNLCAESVKRGENDVYITLELPEEMVVSRIGSNIFSIPSLEYQRYADDTVKFKEKIDGFRKQSMVKPGTLIVKEFPTSTLSVVDLEAYLIAKEEELSTESKPFKFKNVFVDYLNIMRNYRNPNTENTYMKIKQLAEDLRAMGSKNGWSIITATQTNRSQFDTDDISTSQVSESSALGATVDAMFGIIATPIMIAQGEYYLKCMYDRVSPQANKKKKFTCNFNFLRIIEDTTEGIINAAYTQPTTSSAFYKKSGGNGVKPQFNPGVPQVPPEQAVGVNTVENLNTNMPPNEMTSTPLVEIKNYGLF